MTKKSLNCFVAMAFNREDTDEIYDHHFFPVLKDRCHLNPIRIDRQYQKDDLNVAIMKKLDDADIALIDLTYARPSVYYEAGYAERGIPVVYTVRRDHLGAKTQSDNHRVHFDLQMKQIEPWTIPVDPTFDGKLERKIKYALRPVYQKRENDTRIKAEQEAFSKLSLQERYNHISTFFRKKLRSKKFFIGHQSGTYRGVNAGIFLLAVKQIDEAVILCIMIANEKITKKQIKGTIDSIQGKFLINLDTNPDIKEFREFYYFCSLNTVSPSIIGSAIPNAKQLSNPFDFELKLDSLGKKRTSNIHLLSPLKSERDIIEKSQALLDQQEVRKTNTYTTAIGFHNFSFTFNRRDIHKYGGIRFTQK